MKNKRKIDPATTAVPMLIIVFLFLFFVIDPAGSTNILGSIRGFLGDQMGVYYLAIGLGILLVALYIAFSDIGKIVLGKPGERPQYSFFT